MSTAGISTTVEELLKSFDLLPEIEKHKSSQGDFAALA